MGVLLYHTFTFLALFSYGLYHLISDTLLLLKPSSSSSAASAAVPYHPLPLTHRHLRHLPLHLALLSLLLSIAHSLLLSPAPPLPFFASLQSSAALLLFLLLALSLLLPLPPLPHDLIFLLASLAFALLSLASSRSAAAAHASDLQSHCAALSALISSSSAAISLSLALFPRLLILSLALAASVILQGLWALQTGLSLYVDPFIPDGCHRLLDLPDASTRCDFDDARLRAVALLDLAFVLHTTFVAVLSVSVYLAVARASGAAAAAGFRRHNGGTSYDALPTSSSSDQIQMKAIAKSSTQA